MRGFQRGVSEKNCGETSARVRSRDFCTNIVSRLHGYKVRVVGQLQDFYKVPLGNIGKPRIC